LDVIEVIVAADLVAELRDPLFSLLALH
jgi:hypothetical protein